MLEEQTLEEIFEEIAERLAQARTRALLGERTDALGLLQAANLEFTRFRDILAVLPGFLALEYDLKRTLAAMCAEQGVQPDGERIFSAPQASKPRRRAQRAA